MKKIVLILPFVLIFMVMAFAGQRQFVEYESISNATGNEIKFGDGSGWNMAGGIVFYATQKAANSGDTAIFVAKVASGIHTAGGTVDDSIVGWLVYCTGGDAKGCLTRVFRYNYISGTVCTLFCSPAMDKTPTANDSFVLFYSYSNTDRTISELRQYGDEFAGMGFAASDTLYSISYPWQTIYSEDYNFYYWCKADTDTTEIAADPDSIGYTVWIETSWDGKVWEKPTGGGDLITSATGTEIYQKEVSLIEGTPWFRIVMMGTSAHGIKRYKQHVTQKIAFPGR